MTHCGTTMMRDRIRSLSPMMKHLWLRLTRKLMNKTTYSGDWKRELLKARLRCQKELIARSHHRGVVRKRLIPLRFLDDSGKELEQEVAPRSEVLVAASGKKAGTVTTALGSRGLGLLRLEEAFKSPETLAIKGHEGVKVGTTRPGWWPSEWSADNQQYRAAA